VHAGAWRGHRFLEAYQHARAVIGMDQLHRVAAHKLAEVVAEEPSSGRTAVEDRAVTAEQGDGVPALFDQRAEPALADPQRRLRRVLISLALCERERAADGRVQPDQIGLEDVVGGSCFDAFRRGLFVQAPGDDDQGCDGCLGLENLERGHPAEPRYGVVREHDVRPEVRQRAAKRVRRVHA